ncbi:MAG: malto-oligosyltrehalose synthase [Acidimicrobiales bacterium]
MTHQAYGDRLAPRATYRVQLHADFTFDDAAALAPYLADLGISHLYCSPVLQAAPRSTHGYDVVDHSRLSEDLGGEPAFQRLVRALAHHDLSLLVDTVPNHMAVAGRANRWWWDVLEDGPSSRYADHFDIDWASGDPSAGPSVLMPILGDHVGRVIEAGELQLRQQDGAFTVAYHEHELPLSPRSVDGVIAAAAVRCASPELASIAERLGRLPHAARSDRRAQEERHRGKDELRRELTALIGGDPSVVVALDEALQAVAADPHALEQLLDRQNYRLAHWRTADEELDYRRFFSIVTLVGVRVEDEQVFQESHQLLSELVERGDVDGLRIDHIDGLRDPAGYLERLAELLPDAYVTVEKILQRGEDLPDSWPVAGTSGYDLLIRINELFVDPDNEAALTAGYAGFTSDASPFADVVLRAKLDVMEGELAAEIERLTELVSRVCAGHRRHRDHTRRDLRGAVQEVLAAMTVYRTYVVPGRDATEQDRAQVEAAVDAARGRRPDLDGELLAFLAQVLLLDVPGELEHELAARTQQVSAAVMAKGVEDTAFYRYNRLLSLNEVGGDPGTFGGEASGLHEHNTRIAARWPATMATLSTHDTKRSIDVRCRIDLLSELPEAWGAAVQRWSAGNASHRGEAGPDRATEWALYQTLVGAWPIELDRLGPAIDKAAKEAKVHTSWTRPDSAYDRALAGFVEGVLTDNGFVADLEAFLEEHRIVERGRLTSLAQTALLLTSPGVPDVYQGTELWDLSLVDPDNRRPVDHDERRRLLEQLRGAPPLTALAHLDDGGAKLWLIHRVLQHRRASPADYETSAYEPLTTRGMKARHAVAFRRRDLVVVAPRLLVGLDGDWAGTSVDLPAGRWRDVLGDRAWKGAPDLPLEELLATFPVAVLAREAD